MGKDRTAARRQRRRKARLQTQGVTRTTVLVHDECRGLLDSLKPSLRDPRKAARVAGEIERTVRPTNVAQVRQLSPFRYPGGKTWLVPEITSWLAGLRYRPKVLVEPFCGGAIASLTAVAEDLVERAVLVERDEEVAAVWQTILGDCSWLCRAILKFKVTERAVRRIIEGSPGAVEQRAFRTIVKNRTQRGGILAAGASLVKNGENGRGLRSRWYPETLVRRIQIIHGLRDRLEFVHGDGLGEIRKRRRLKRCAFFIDPPYTASGGKKAGKRLYTHSELDHEALFDLMGTVAGDFLLTYDNAAEVRALAAGRKFNTTEVPMKNAHHALLLELLVTNS